jgi:hypothetical protein
MLSGPLAAAGRAGNKKIAAVSAAIVALCRANFDTC